MSILWMFGLVMGISGWFGGWIVPQANAAESQGKTEDLASGDSDAKLVKKDGTVVSPVPQGVRLEDGDRLVSGSKDLKVVANGVEVQVSPGSTLEVTKKTSEGARPEIILSVTEGKVNSPSARGAEGPVSVVTPSGQRQVIVDASLAAPTSTVGASVSNTGRSPASVGTLNSTTVSKAPTVAPVIIPPPPPLAAQVIGTFNPAVQMEIPVGSVPPVPTSPVPVFQPIERPMSAQGPEGSSTLRVNVGVQ